MAGDTHWSFWVIAGLALLYNLAGTANFFMQMDPDGVAGLPEAYRQLIEQRPGWATAAFGVAVMGAVVGCVLLLLRRTLATPLFWFALAGAVVVLLQTFTVDADAGMLVGNGIQIVVTAFLVWYSGSVTAAEKQDA